MQIAQNSSWEDLLNLLENFAQNVRQHPKLEKTLAHWHRFLFLQIADAPEVGTGILIKIQQHHMVVAATKITQQQLQQDFATNDQPLALLQLRGPLELFRRIFSGEISPAESYFDGELEVFASEEDQVKLDVISLLLWGD